MAEGGTGLGGVDCSFIQMALVGLSELTDRSERVETKLGHRAGFDNESVDESSVCLTKYRRKTDDIFSASVAPSQSVRFFFRLEIRGSVFRRTTGLLAVESGSSTAADRRQAGRISFLKKTADCVRRRLRDFRARSRRLRETFKEDGLRPLIARAGLSSSGVVSRAQPESFCCCC